ncbi:hypothetical protein N7537_010482 [Penicillium hordei]|uniref:Prolyl 4-hydroxylase alpha subunit Fe(2+) 2OG dioxygenase domain-containing protein n=1 Tax=Penicillium hordei TaxID=40994 RepID=A0AAD6GWQ4_9EURO|nr:uncharacterized protein N7537_010482 [Penicillium hordei]KAJ5593578.1 hypothetical protein N7537_010482 [Penicillium hordei]
MPRPKRTCPPMGTPNSKRRDQNPDPDGLLRSIKDMLTHDSSEVLFSVGGKINLTSDPDTTHEKRDPVTFRWDSGPHGSHVKKISFPVVETQVAVTDSLAHLLKDCEPASFGRGNQELIDEGYRQASTLDIQKFSSDYSPYDNRVMEKVSQALAFRGVADNSHRGLRAELYKMNIYSAPSGMFKAHVDTPRSEHQMGSLVVCLPTPHEGGELTIRRQGRQNVYSWGPLSTSHIQWAAFYSDEEHEVGKVTKGQHVTLTYNLYWVSYGPASMECLIGEDLGLLSWVAKLDELTKCKVYLKNLGRLGFHTIQHYPHSASAAARGNIEEQLKRLDMLVFQAFKRLSGNVRVTAVVDGTAHEEKCRYQERDSSSDQNTGNDSKERKDSEGFSSESPPDTGKYYVGKGLHSPFLEDQLADEEEWPSPGQFGKRYDFQQRTWSEAWYSGKKVIWLNREPNYGSKEFAMATIVTGNEPTTRAYYSTAAIIAEFV